MIRLIGLPPEKLAPTIEQWARDTESQLARLAVQAERPKYLGHNASSVGPGEYTHVNAISAITIQLRKPSINDIWRHAAVYHANTTSLTVQAVGCALNGVTDGQVQTSECGLLQFCVMPGALGAEWATNNAVIAAETTATIAGGVLPFTSPRMMVDTEGGAPTDDLDTIAGGVPGQELLLYTTSDSRDVVIIHSSHIRTHTGLDVTIASSDSRAKLVCRSPDRWSLLSVAL